MNDDELVFRARNGNMQAFAELIDIHTPTVRRFAFQLGNKYDDIDDITQEVFVRVYRFMDQFSHTKFTTWLYKITLNVTRDFARSKQRQIKKVLKIGKERTYNGKTAEESILRYEEDRVLHECIQKMDEKYRIPIVLFYFHDKSYDEIADITGASLSNVKTRMSRGKEHLKKLLTIAEKKEGANHG
ncbi:RNA polymerase sigma factor [Mesobacillus thioparans]|uniref:RNA polymerase sigma factor n=1 Tax=Mesobacillus thioparans TaxID=370439 RepID=UPI0039EF8F32